MGTPALRSVASGFVYRLCLQLFMFRIKLTFNESKSFLRYSGDTLVAVKKFLSVCTHGLFVVSAWISSLISVII